MSKRVFLSGRWRPVAVGVVALALMAGLFSLAPVRQAAADFLGTFRVRKFTVVSVDPAQLQKLDSLQGLVQSGMLGEPTILRQPGEAQTAPDAASASTAAGFKVRAPQYLPQGATGGLFSVQVGPAMHIEMDRASMQTALEAIGVQGAKLPAMDKLPIDLDVPVVVEQHYSLGRSSLNILQAPSPTVTFPAAVDTKMLGTALLQALGMSAQDAEKLSKTIDWTSTLVIPLPTNVARFREVTIDGVSGLLLEGSEQSGSAGAALWQKDGLLYSVTGVGIDSGEILKVAGSLR